MKEKNLPDDIRSKSLDDLTEEVDKIIEQLEKTNNLENSIDQYNKLIKLNNFIEKKFQTISKQINLKSKEKINNIIKKND